MPRLDPRHATRVAFALALAAGAALGCSSLTDEEEQRLASYKQRSKEYYDAAHFERAQDQCRRGLTLAPEDQSLLQVLGMSLLRQIEPIAGVDRRLQEAAATFEKAIELEDERDFRSRFGLGEVEARIVSLRLEQLDAVQADEKLTQEERGAKAARLEADLDSRAIRAEEALGDALSDPRTKDNDLALSTLARLLCQLRRYEEADETLTHLIAVLTRSLHLRSQQLDVQNQPADVRLAIRGDIEHLKSTRIDALKLRTVVLSKMERNHEVVAVYSQIEAEQAMQPADYFNRAQANERIGAKDAAISDYDTFIARAAASGKGLNDTVRTAIQRKAELKLASRTQPPPQ